MKGKPEFDCKDRGYRIRAWYQGEKSDALVKITCGRKLLRRFLYPAYKIWNLAAHFSDIVDSEIQNNTKGYQIAGSTGFGGCVMPKSCQAPAPGKEEVSP